MDSDSQQKIISRHGHLVSSGSPFIQVKTNGKFNAEESGPPSPSSGVVNNFGEVESGRIYRSSFPQAPNIEHLKSLGLKSILTLVDTPLSEEYIEFIDEEEVQHYRMLIPAHKSPESEIPIKMVIETLRIIVNPSNYPLLIHCNKGKHRTGCMVACYRKLQHWTDAAIITEYRNYASSKFRPLDEVFIASFNAPLAQEILDNATNIPYTPLSPLHQLPLLPRTPSLETDMDFPISPLVMQAMLPTPPQSEKDADLETWEDSCDSRSASEELSPEPWW